MLNYAIVKKYMSAPNPAAWSGNLNALLPSKSKTTKVKNHPALQLKDARRWWSKLIARDGQGRNALMMLTLTAARSREIRGMHWDEVHLFDANVEKQRGFFGIWTIPAHRMKTKVEHRVPITAPMRELLRAMEAREGLVFPAAYGRILSDMTLSALMKRLHLSDDEHFVDQRSQRPAVPHGQGALFAVQDKSNQTLLHSPLFDEFCEQIKK